MTQNLFSALRGRLILVGLSGLMLVGLACADQASQPGSVKVPPTQTFRLEEPTAATRAAAVVDAAGPGIVQLTCELVAEAGGWQPTIDAMYIEFTTGYGSTQAGGPTAQEVWAEILTRC